MLNLFYEEPDPDRWLPGDRYPRQVIRRLVRGKPQPGGMMRWFLNLRAGLDQLGVKYRVNDYAALRRTPGAWACVVGKPQVVDQISAGHPIIYGPAIASHPSENYFWEQADIRLLLIPCEWFKAMYERDLPRPLRTAVWPAGIDTELWKSAGNLEAKKTDFLIYDKVRWEHDRYEVDLLNPIRAELKRRGLSYREIRYGSYREVDFRRMLQECRAMIFLCEHETQGFAYLQALASGIPLLAWDRGGIWRDPQFLAAGINFGPVTSVPYWDARCGLKFADASEFVLHLDKFWADVRTNALQPRSYILDKLTLAKCAHEYLQLCELVGNKP